MAINYSLFLPAILATYNQGRGSLVNVKCAYRGPDGVKCGAGHMIEDDEFREEYNTDVSIGSYCAKAGVPRLFVAALGEHANEFHAQRELQRFVEHVQTAHDRAALKILNEPDKYEPSSFKPLFVMFIQEFDLQLTDEQQEFFRAIQFPTE